MKIQNVIKETLLPPTHIHTQNVTELKSNKKVATPPFLHQPPPPLQGYFPCSSKIFGTHPLPYKSLNFWKVLLPPFNKGTGGGVQLCLPNYYQIALSKIGSRVAQR